VEIHGYSVFRVFDGIDSFYFINKLLCNNSAMAPVMLGTAISGRHRWITVLGMFTIWADEYRLPLVYADEKIR